jgi:hypothetical protein
MASTPITTFHDLVDHLLDHFGGLEEGRNLKMARRAVLSAHRGLPSTYNWRYYYKRGRIYTEAKYDTGTIAYDHTGGANEREVKLVSGTWPTNAKRGILRISNIDYHVADRIDGTVITLSVNSNPQKDVASGTSYTWVRDAYPMPIDFQSAADFRTSSKNWTWPTYVTPGEWLDAHKSLEASNNPRIYTFMADPDFVGALSAFFYPPPSSAETFDFIYQKVPLPIRTVEYKTGTISGASGTTTITGDGTVFHSKHVGSVIRVGTVKNLPDSLEGLYPFEEERVIVKKVSDTEVTLDEALDTGFTDVKYRISDIIDIEYGAMMEAFLAYAELRMSVLMKDPDIGEKQDLYAGALRIAMQADNRSFGDETDHPYAQITHLRDQATITP